MKRLKVLLLIFIVCLTTSCASKFQGTWCKYSDVATSLVILDYNISENDLTKIVDYISTIPNLKFYDLIGEIEDASKMITIYYKNEENVDEYQEVIKTYNGVKSIKFTSIDSVLDKLVIKRDSYTYDKDLNDFSVTEVQGTYSIANNKLILDNNLEFYYKNKFLCSDKDCNEILTKAKGNECIR